MAVSFSSGNTSKGSNVARFSWKTGVNKFRVVSGLMPLYRAWVKTAEGKSVPFEDLSFDRDKQTFSPKADNPVAARFGELKMAKLVTDKEYKSKWSYVVKVINRDTGNVELLDLKKGMFGDMVSVCEQLGVDPADSENGIEWVVKKEGAGLTTSYTVQQLASKPAPMSAEDKELVAEAPTIEEDCPRETVASQNSRIDRLLGIEESEATDQEAASDLD